MLSPLDEVLDYSVDYEVDGVHYAVEVRITSKVESEEDLIQEVCDVMTVSKATSEAGYTYDHDGWREILNDAGLEQDFWEEAVEKYVMIQICIKSFEPGHA